MISLFKIVFYFYFSFVSPQEALYREKGGVGIEALSSSPLQISLLGFTVGHLVVNRWLVC